MLDISSISETWSLHSSSFFLDDVAIYQNSWCPSCRGNIWMSDTAGAAIGAPTNTDVYPFHSVYTIDSNHVSNRPLSMNQWPPIISLNWRTDSVDPTPPWAAGMDCTSCWAISGTPWPTRIYRRNLHPAAGQRPLGCTTCNRDCPNCGEFESLKKQNADLTSQVEFLQKQVPSVA